MHFLFSVEIWRLKLSVKLLRQILSYFVCIYIRNWQTINMMMMMMMIAFHCHSSRKFRIRLASTAVANRDLFFYFCTPIFNDLYPPMIFGFSKVTNICE